MATAIQIRPELIEKAWPLVKEWVAAAQERGKGNDSIEDIRSALERQVMRLWLAWDKGRAKGCCITQLHPSIRGPTCAIIVVGGDDFAEWKPLTEHIKRWAKSLGCVRLEASGRAGWERKVRDDGWVKIRTTIEMDLK